MRLTGFVGVLQQGDFVDDATHRAVHFVKASCVPTDTAAGGDAMSLGVAAGAVDSFQGPGVYDMEIIARAATVRGGGYKLQISSFSVPGVVT